MTQTNRKKDSGSYGVLIHGAGWVSSQHIAAYQNNPETRIVAISSRTLESAQQRAAEAGLEGVAVYQDLDQALNHPEVDIVSVCTPQHLHCSNVLSCADAGKHIVIEKPVGISLEELARMRTRVHEAGVRTVVSFVLRWNPWFQTLKKLIHQGTIGQPYYVETDYCSHNGSWWSGWEDARSADRGVSAFLVAGCHAVDALRWFAACDETGAADPIEVYAVSGGYRKGQTSQYDPFHHRWIEDAPPMEYNGLEIALVKFSNGVLGKVSVNMDCIMPYRFPIRVFGDRGSVMDNRVWSHQYPGQTDWVEIPSVLPDSSDVTHHPFQAQIDHFVECIRENRESHCNLDDAIKTHEIVFGALEAYQSGVPVKLPLLLPSD